MTIKELIDYVGEIRPNSYGYPTMAIWINEIEGAVQTEIRGIHPDDAVSYDGNTDPETVLLVGSPHAKLYAWYVVAMIDLVTMGDAAYENSYRIFNNFWNEYARWYLRTHRTV